MALTSGFRIGVYEIVSLLGAGGMGEVYRATDTILKRHVALKVLPPEVAGFPERVARFQREAEVLAALNHPNIAHIFGLEKGDTGFALVMELVDGPTLADRIARGAVPLDEALLIAGQIVNALEAAHDSGTVHRDLKPANIKIRPDGTVKVLDFGLAKAMEPARSLSDPSLMPTTTNAGLSHAGVILGTAAYMSPEQAAGLQVDRRSDIWSFGVVLWEMLTGQQAFTGETSSHVMAAVLRADPDWNALAPDTPASIRRLLHRCLNKDVRRRLDSAAMIRLELDEARTASSTETAATAALPAASVPPGRRTRGWLFVTTAFVAGAALAMLGTRAFVELAAPAPAPVTRFTITPSNDLPVRPSLQAAARDFAVAPDGTFLVYRAGSRGQLVVRRFNQLEATLIPGVTAAVMPFISPDSRWIAFVNDSLLLKKVPATGGEPVTIARLPVWPRGGTWVDDATIIIGTNSPSTGLLRVPAGGGDPTVLTTPDRARGEEGHILPSALPGGRAVLFTIGAADPKNAQVALLDLSSGQQTTLIRGARDAQYVESGHIVYLSGFAMAAVRFDLSNRAVVGEPVRVLDEMASAPTSALNVAATRAGTMVFLPRGAAASVSRTLVWVDRKGKETPVAAPPRAYESVRLSPDGSQAAVSIRDQENDVWVWNFARQTLTRQSFDADIDMVPVWTPDGRSLIFSSTRAGVYNLYLHGVNAAGSDVRLTSGANTQLPESVTPDGKSVIAHEVRPDTGSDIVRIPFATDREATTTADDLVQTQYDEWNGEVSPDGRFFVYQSDESGQFEIYVRPYPEVGSARWQVSSGGGSPIWAPGGRELIYLDRAQRLTSVSIDTSRGDVRTGTPATFGPAPAIPGPWRVFDVSPDGQRFLVIKQEGGAPADVPPRSFVVVENWFEELKQLVPRK